MWKYYEVELQIRDKIIGGVPKNPTVIADWIKAKTGLEGDTLEKVVKRAKYAIGATTLTEDEIGALAEASWNGFKANGDGLYIDEYQVKAMLKEAANVTKAILGITNFKSKIAEWVFVNPPQIPLGVTEPSGQIERPVRAMTAMGPRTSLKRVDYVSQPLIRFSLKVLDMEAIVGDRKSGKRMDPGEYLPLLLEYASENGLGADRSMGFGKFDVVKFEEALG